MALLNECGNNWYQSLPACADGFTVQLPGLLPETDYWWTITDQFQHIYSEIVTTDANGRFIVSASEFPEGYFTESRGRIVMEIKGNPYYCEPLSFTMCGVDYNRFVLDFKKGDLPAVMPCQC